MKKNQTLITNSAEETLELGEKFAKELKPKDIVCLSGELGAGKTTFIKGIAKGFGIEKTISSPTFIIMRTYEVLNNELSVDSSSPSLSSKQSLENKNGIRKLYHLDLYRLETDEEIRNIGFEEILNDEKGVVLIEWAEKAKGLLPKKRIDLSFEYVDDSHRKIKAVNTT